MGLRTVFTDHSLYGFGDTGAILTNKLLRFALADVGAVVCVSFAGKVNTSLRAHVNPRRIYVIPNAVVASQFKPAPGAARTDQVTIMVASRLTFLKGADLLIQVVPRICALFPDVSFVIVGDGPQRHELEQMREARGIQDRVDVLGTIRHEQVRDVLVQGHIFLNTSLTDAFCIGVVEAACAGLLVVSTRVGGIPEVLPDHMIFFAEPNVDDLVTALSRAVHSVKRGDARPELFYKEIADMYSWKNVAERTEKVYTKVCAKREPSLAHRLVLYSRVGPLAGMISIIIVLFDIVALYILEFFWPAEDIEIAMSWSEKSELDSNEPT
ncbi:hypothetical protein HDU93_007451 [Gonapodya sp. JEL0774]|nr:hypothetical protein HDU93_007451 [Gonapodya sp. JEL0774]